jgi:hypothetical protein
MGFLIVFDLCRLQHDTAGGDLLLSIFAVAANDRDFYY